MCMGKSVYMCVREGVCEGVHVCVMVWSWRGWNWVMVRG